MDMSENMGKKRRRKKTYYACIAAGETMELHDGRPHYIRGRFFFFISKRYIYQKKRKKNAENYKRRKRKKKFGSGSYNRPSLKTPGTFDDSSL